MLRRSTDGGLTWPEENNVILCDKTISEEQKKAFLYQPGATRADYDMFSPDSLFFFARMYLADRRSAVCFALRSPDRGRTWESVPTIINHPDGPQYRLERGCDPIIRMPDGKTLLAPISIHRPGSGIAIYSSTDNGITWNFLSRAATAPAGGGWFTYPALLPMPGGELQLYTLNITSDVEVKGTRNAICVTSSFDGGRTWSKLRPIVSPESQGAWGTDITPIIRDRSFGHWTNLGKSGNNEKFYRSPWAILLDDGRILVVFTRRRDPIGLGGVVSKDGGRTWSDEFVIRDDGPVRDLGYQVGSQLEDGRIVISYYYSVADGNKFGGTRCILGSSFRIK